MTYGSLLPIDADEPWGRHLGPATPQCSRFGRGNKLSVFNESYLTEYQNDCHVVLFFCCKNLICCYDTGYRVPHILIFIVGLTVIEYSDNMILSDQTSKIKTGNIIPEKGGKKTWTFPV